MDQDIEKRYKAAVRRFFYLLQNLKRETGEDLRSWTHMDVWGNNQIEVCAYAGERKERTLVVVKNDDDTRCYEIAGDRLEWILQCQKKGDGI